MAEMQKALRLVDRDPMGDTIGKAIDDRCGVVLEPLDNLPINPAPLVLDVLRQVPVVECHPRLNAGRQEPIDQLIVEANALSIDRLARVGNDARPGDRKPIGLRADLLHQLDILAKPMVMVAGDVAVIPVLHSAFAFAKRIPNARRATTFATCSLNLVGRCGRSP